MSDFPGVTGTAAPADPRPLEAAAERNRLDYDAFLRLLTAQLTNQDPTKPMDSTEYVAQLATFSQVEQSIQTNRKLEGLVAAHALSSADGLIGRTATSGDGSVSGEIVSIRIATDGAVATLADGETLALGAGTVIS